MGDKRILINRRRDDDEAWYTAMIDQYTFYVTAIISGIAKGSLSVSDMEEVAADVFFRVWMKRGEIRQESIKAFIAQIARNASIDRLRKTGEAFIPYDDDILQVACPACPEESVIAEEQQQIVQAAVAAFEAPEREIFVRFYYFGETLQSISHALHMNASTAKTKLHRLRQKLKAVLQERGYGCE